MVNPGDISVSMKGLAENSDSVMGGSGSKVDDNVGRVSVVRRDDGGGFDVAGVSERVVEAETVVASTRSESNGDADVAGIDVWAGVAVRDEKIKDVESACKENGGREGSDGKRLSGNGCNEGGNGEKLEDSDHGFRVGDVVWSKIKSHPWWPGQIYDTKDASDFAVKYRQEGRLLVAFFGDGSCSWCLPSQLIPFVENFKEMSTDSSSRSFFKAIQGAVDEVGRLLESEMTCKCVPVEKRDGLGRPVVQNAGLKAGVFAPEVDIHRLSVPNHGPAEILAKVVHLAKSVEVDSALELAVLKSTLSAFYRAKGGQLPVYREPVYVEGLEDDSKDETAMADDYTVPIEVPIVGPKEDECLPSPTGASAKLPDSLNETIYHRRKQKSVAELMGEKTDAKPKTKKRSTVKEDEDVGKSSSSFKRRKRKHAVVEEGGSKGGGSKKKAKVSRPAEMANENVSDVEENSGDGDADKEGRETEAAAAAPQELDLVSSPRERKKSKYLSPPYTDPRWKMGSQSIKMESKPVKSSKTVRVGEQTTKASEDLHGSPPPSNIVDEACDDDKLPIRQLKGLENTSVSATPQTVENDKKLTFSASDVDNVQVNELLSRIEFAAVNPLFLSNEGSIDTVCAFVSALRSSTYLHGPDYKIFQKCKRSRRRKSTPSRLQDQENESKSAAKMKTPKAEKTEEKPDASKSKKASEISLAEEKSEGKASSCLVLTFTPGFPLPSKEEIVRLFSKFGSLNEKETNVMADSHTVQIAYMKDSDADAAFKSSINESPFGIENVNYWLQHGSKPRGSFLPPIKWAPEETESSNDVISDIRAIRQKVEIMTAILENYHSKFSSEDKASLKDELKLLSDSVETASEKVRVVAEKTSSLS